MKRVHFDSKGPVKWHYFFWQPWGCFGCLWRTICFMILLSLFLFLLSQFKSCSNESANAGTTPGADRPISVVVPPINEDDVIEEDGRQVVSNRINVLFDAETGTEQHEEWIQRFNELYPGDEYQILFFDPETKLMSIQVPAERRAEMIENLPDQIPDIPFLVFDETVMEMGVRANDPVFRHDDHAYYFNMLDTNRAWDITLGDPSVLVAIVDSYFDLENVEFRNTRIERPWSVARGDSIVSLPADYNPRRPNPVYAHGTMVAAMALGALGNGRASAGIAPACSLLPISLGARFGCLAMLQGILYAINHQAKVINISAGISFTEEISSLSVEEQIALARTELLSQQAVWQYVYEMAQRNYVTLVWAAGNEDVFTAIDASKRGESTIKVSAVDGDMRKAEFSNFGNFPEENVNESTVSAPGVQIPGLIPGTEGYMLVDGTSFSAPIVTGTVALMKSIDATLTTPEIITILQQTGQPVRGNTTIGPIINTGAAVERVFSTTITFEDFQRKIREGNGHFQSCGLTTAPPEPNALPVIYLVQITSQGPDRGQISLVPNRANMETLSGSFNLRRSNNSLTFSFNPTQEADASTMTITADENGRAVVSASTGVLSIGRISYLKNV